MQCVLSRQSGAALLWITASKLIFFLLAADGHSFGHVTDSSSSSCSPLAKL